MYDLSQPKFIIQDGEFRMGRVVVHRELVTKDGGDVLGGGWWYFDMDAKIMYLYGKSIDYGQVKAEDFEDVWLRPWLEDMTIYFSTENDLDLAKQNNIIIQDKDDERTTH